MSSSQEPFNIVKFFEFGTFKPEDVQTLNSIGDDDSIPRADFPIQCFRNLIAMPSSATELDDDAWLREATVDTVLIFLRDQYPNIHFVLSMDWSNKSSIVEKRIHREASLIASRRFLVSCICLDHHWYWLVCDFELNVAYYGDNYNTSDGNAMLETYITTMALLVAIATEGARGLRIKLCPVRCPEFKEDINNCGVYALCFLLMMLESNCDPEKLQGLFNLNLFSLDKMPFLRYRLAMCVALGVLNVPIDYAQTEVKEDTHIPDLPVVPLLELDLYFSNLDVKNVEMEASNEWSAPIVLADLRQPAGLADPHIWILYFIGSNAGISTAELIRLCEEKCIGDATIYQYLNISCRVDERFKQIPKSRRIVRHYCDMYYLTMAAIPHFRAWAWEFSRYNELTLKKKVSRRVQKKRPLLAIEDGVKKKRPYQKSGHDDAWKDILCELIEPFPIPMTTTAIKNLYKKKYRDTSVLTLAQQQFTLRLLQAVNTLETGIASKRGKSRRADANSIPAPSTIIKLPNELTLVVDHANIVSSIKAMSMDFRSACVEYMKFADSRKVSRYDADYFTLDDSTNFRELIRRAAGRHEFNVDRAAEYTEWLIQQIEDVDLKLQFIEFIIRSAIARNIESLEHFQKLFVCDAKTKIKWVTAEHLCGKWPRNTATEQAARLSRTETTKKQKSACTVFIARLKHILYINQCEKNANPALAWECLVFDNEAESRLVCSIAQCAALFAVDQSGYLILREPVYYGTLIEIPDGSYLDWFVFTSLHTDPTQNYAHAYYMEMHRKRYLECHANVRAGQRFFHNL
jgi:hypothetical protein